MTSDAAYRAVFRRVVWYPFLLYFCAYLDRLYIGFAALAMNRDLGLTPTTFGAANTIFHLGCMVFEVPSNLLLARFGARTSQFRTAVPPRSSRVGRIPHRLQRRGIVTTRKRPDANARRKKSKRLTLSKETLKDLSPKKKMPIGGRAHDDNCTRNATGCW